MKFRDFQRPDSDIFFGRKNLVSLGKIGSRGIAKCGSKGNA
jgi:hypothetical protein